MKVASTWKPQVKNGEQIIVNNNRLWSINDITEDAILKHAYFWNQLQILWSF